MAKVLLLSLSEENPLDHSFKRGVYIRLKESAAMGKARHTLVDSPEEADIIFFAEMYITFAFKIRRHPYYRAYRDKCFAFSISDQVLPFVPGVYASIERRCYSPRRVRSGFYLSLAENESTRFDPAPVERDLLYSFVGSVKTAPVRSRLATLRHPRSLFIDTSKESLQIHLGGPSEQRAIFWRRFADVARRSHFVLCPRGEGASSVRLFEMMQMARVPVILADAWVPPEGPRWDEFSIRIPERDYAKIPEILERREADSAALGRRAREEWEKWFAPDAVFNTVIDWCLEIKASRRMPEALATLALYPHLLRPPFLRLYLQTWKNYLKTGK